LSAKRNPDLPPRCDLFNKAYNHISDRIDQVYKELTKGKAAPMGGVAYLSLEDSEVRFTLVNFVLVFCLYDVGTVQWGYQIPCHATDEAFPRYGTTLWRRKDGGSSGAALCYP
jgi:structural maintenance of chromosome 1